MDRISQILQWDDGGKDNSLDEKFQHHACSEFFFPGGLNYRPIPDLSKFTLVMSKLCLSYNNWTGGSTTCKLLN
jgi:hypothetical protein